MALVTIRIEGDAAEDRLMKKLLAFADRVGLKPTAAARMLLKAALEYKSPVPQFPEGTR